MRKKVQIFKEGDLVYCISSSAPELIEGALYTVASSEIRNNKEFIRLKELSHIGVSYYSWSFILKEKNSGT